MKYKYIGDHECLNMYGMSFERNQPVDVTDKKIRIRKSVARPGGTRENIEAFIMVEDKLKGNVDFELVQETEQGHEFIPAEKPKRKYTKRVKDDQTGIKESSFTAA